MVLPKLEERVSRSSWKMILGKPTDNSRAAGEADDVWGETSGWKEWKKDDAKNDAYPAGIPLSTVEIKSSRNFRPKSLEDGSFLCWDYSSHAGCKAPNGTCTRGKHEVIKTKGLHPLIRMHLARRGGHRAEKKIQIKDIDGHVQSLRDQLTEEDLEYQRSPKSKSQPKAGGGVLDIPDTLTHVETASVVDGGNAADKILTDINPVIVNAMDSAPLAWRDAVFPTDFGHINFTPLEEGNRLLAASEDAWANEIDSLPILPHPEIIADRLDSVTRPVSYAAEWIRDSSFDVHPSIQSLVVDSMLSYDTVPEDNSAMVER